MHKMSQSGWNIYVCQKIMVHVRKRLKPLFLDPFFQYCKYSHASKVFVYLCGVISISIWIHPVDEKVWI